MSFRLRVAAPEDVPDLQRLIEVSVRGLQAGDYSAEQLDASLKTVYGVDTQLIADGTYFVVEQAADAGQDLKGKAIIVGCGGWSRRKTLYGGDQWSGRE